MTATSPLATEVSYAVADHVAKVTINRPHRINAMSDVVMRDLVQFMEVADNDPDVRVVVLAGAGTRGFCVGRDLKETRERDERLGNNVNREPLPMRGLHRNVFEAVLECGKPTVAGIFGHTLGGGAELSLACDVRIAADDLSFGFTEATLGLGANFGSQLLPRLVPLTVAYDLLYTARRIGAQEALSVGLVSLVVAPDTLQDALDEWARKVAANAPITTRRYKAMIAKGRDLPIAAALRLDVGPNPYTSEDRLEGVAAWNEGRAPIWNSR